MMTVVVLLLLLLLLLPRLPISTPWCPRVLFQFHLNRLCLPCARTNPTCRYTAFSESWVTAYKIPMHFIDECDTLTCRSLVTTPNLFSMRPLKPSRQHP